MCGICGIYEFARSGPPRLDPIERMTTALAHRGPDSAGIWTKDRVALGHRRLSIFDLSPAGTQPMASPDGSVLVVFNGEIYNFPELREVLVQDGFKFRTETDTEVLIALYQKRGIAALDDLRGMFAVALWDDQREKLYLVRDRLGVKPVYYAERDGVLVFASEIKSVLQHPEVRPVLARERLSEWLALRYTLAPGTLLRNVHKLEAGHYLVVDRAGIRKVRYWDVVPEPRVQGRLEAIEAFRGLFREAVKLRLRADVPVGVFLSGGLDSSMIALEAADAVSHPLRTFTVGYRETESINEFQRARVVADYLGTEHHELVLDHVAPEVLDSVVWHVEEPIGDPATVLLYLLAEFTRRHVTVVLSGEGSDETNFGYGKTVAFDRWSSLAQQRPIGPLLERAWVMRNAPAAMARPWSVVDEPRAYAELSWSGAGTRAALAGGQAGDWLRGLHHTMRNAAVSDRFGRLVYLDLKGWLADDLLLKVDKTTMAHALEAREPFLDHLLVEFNLRLPVKWKVGVGGTKLFAREAVRGRLPDCVIRRKQHGFIAPLGAWFAGGWHVALEEVLRPDAPSTTRRVLSPDLHRRVQQGLRAGCEEASVIAFMLLSLERWLRLFKVEIES